MTPIETVHQIYAAFGRGDVPFIVSCLDEHVDWDYGMVDAGVPWLQHRHGHAGALAFFESLAGVDITEFIPRAIVGEGQLVVALIDLKGVVKATGRRVAEEHEVHLWHFNEAGKVVRFCHKVDTYQHWRALQA
ncbi:MAG: nuclear transport factor 2 family protein [Vicinamibacterales bacterium]